MFGTCERCQKFKKSLSGLVAATVISTALGIFFLPMIGFGLIGVTAGSLAALWQSTMPLVASGSLFAGLQSLGATGWGALLFGGSGFVGPLAFRRIANFCTCEPYVPVSCSTNSKQYQGFL